MPAELSSLLGVLTPSVTVVAIVGLLFRTEARITRLETILEVMHGKS